MFIKYQRLKKNSPCRLVNINITVDLVLKERGRKSGVIIMLQELLPCVDDFLLLGLLQFQ